MEMRRVLGRFYTAASSRYRLWTFVTVLLSVLSIVTLWNYMQEETARPTFPLGKIQDTCVNVEEYKSPSPQSIPNLVHYVWLLKDPAEFRLDFKIFVSIYSALFYFRPEQIYIHTDASPAVFENAKESTDVWTRRILSLPGVTPQYVTPPASTTAGVPIVHMEHKADFLRIEALRSFGGIYLDADAVPLRDVAGLRHAGFANVVGGAAAIAKKHQGYINNGVMLAVPGSMMMQIWHTAAHRFFDGGWATASIHLLTDLAERLGHVQSEILILHPRAFAPTSWEIEDQKKLFSGHPHPTALAGGQGCSRARGPPSHMCGCTKPIRSEGGKSRSWRNGFLEHIHHPRI